MLDLTGALAKIERAKKHIRDLDAERAAFLGSNPYTITPEFYAEKNSTLYFLDESAPIPLYIPLIAGDAAHNLRAALDYLACERFRVTTGKEPGGDIYFPIYESPQEGVPEAQRKTKGIPQIAQKVISDFKSNGGGYDMLWGLHRLDIVDKHKLLMIVAFTSDKIKVNLSADFLNSVSPGFIRFGPNAVIETTVDFLAPTPLSALEKGALLYSIAGNYEADKDIYFTLDIAFGEPDVLKGKAVIPTLVELTTLVESIVLSFE